MRWHRVQRRCTWCGKRMMRRVQNGDDARYHGDGRKRYRWMWCCEDYFARGLLQTHHEHDAKPCPPPRHRPTSRQLVFA